jgi:hypothetical protein
MSHAIIRKLYRAVDECRWTALAEFFDEKVVYERPGYPPIVGLADLTNFYEHVRVIGSGDHQIEDIIVEGPTATCWGRFVGKRRDGAPVDEQWSDVFRFEGEKFRFRRSYFFRPAV